MAAEDDYSRVNRLLPILAGVVLIGAAFLVDRIAAGEAAQPELIALIVSGCAFVVLSLASRHRQFSAALAKASLVILSLTLLLTVSEVLFRVVAFDFDRFNRPGDEVPIYYRAPTVHAGEGIFRRPGPASWRGKVLSAYMLMHGTNEGPYSNERPVVAEYDALGFRNPTDLTNWEVVVTGDSFVESGYLPYEDLFTTVAAKRLGLRIKNLGVSATGPISQTFYVRNYGKAESTKDAVLCFFEGNDLKDLNRELRSTASFRATGQPWKRRKQVSLLKALHARYSQLRGRGAPAHRRAGLAPNAVLVTAAQERPMTVRGIAPSWDWLDERSQEAIVRALANWADTARSKGMRPWVMYLPDSHRVFHGLMRYADTNSPVAHWEPGDFAAHLGSACTNLDIAFIDSFPALRREAEAGRVPYNLIGDTHLSIEGSRVVGNLLADALKSIPSLESGLRPSQKRVSKLSL